MVLPDDNATARQTNQMSDSTLDNVFLSPGIRLSDLDTQRAGASSSSSQLSRSRRVGEWVSVPEMEDVEMQDAEEQDDDPKRTITVPDDDSKRTITVRDSSSPEKVDPSNAAATAGSKRSLGDFQDTPSPWLSSAGKTDGGDTTESARSKRSKTSADSEETVTETSRASSSYGADGSLNTTRAGSKTSSSAGGSGSSASARTPTTQSSQRSSAAPPALDGTSEQRGSSSSAGPSSPSNNASLTTSNTTTNKGKGRASIHDLSAASYLARHQAQIAQNYIAVPASPQHPAAPTACSSSASAPPPSIVLSPPAETCKKKQALILENRALQTQLIEQNFQSLWTRRENFLRFFAKTHGITLDVTLDAKRKKMNPAEGSAKNNDDAADADKRKDSFEASSSSPSTSNKPPDFPTLLARARERALELLLEAWYEKLGTRSTPSDGWTKYSEKTTTSAVLNLRSILATGDTDLKIPISFLPGPKQTYWKHKLASVRFWFTSVNHAVDFLSAFGIGGEQTRFGSGISRVEVLQYSLEDSGGKCLSENHHASERAWKGGLEGWMPNEFPPVRYCPCSEYKLLMKIVGNAQKLPDPGGERAIRWMSERLTREWQKANLLAGVDVAREGWPSEVGERNMPLLLPIGGVPGFGLWHCLGRDEEKKLMCRTIRLEGRFADLL
jgi:hypothetical protein